MSAALPVAGPLADGPHCDGPTRHEFHPGDPLHDDLQYDDRHSDDLLHDDLNSPFPPSAEHSKPASKAQSCSPPRFSASGGPRAPSPYALQFPGDPQSRDWNAPAESTPALAARGPSDGRSRWEDWILKPSAADRSAWKAPAAAPRCTLSLPPQWLLAPPRALHPNPDMPSHPQ